MPKFEKGKSGNPTGKPKGTRHRATQAAEVLLDGEAERLTRKAIELALDGDTTALKLTLDRIIPPRKDRTVRLELPEIARVSDLPTVTGYLAQAVSNGHITPLEAGELSKLILAHISAIAATDLEERINNLERKNEAAS